MSGDRGSRATETDRSGETYRLDHPVRYAGVAASLAALVATPLDLVLFAHGWSHAWRVGVSSAATWFVVLLVIAFAQRVKLGR